MKKSALAVGLKAAAGHQKKVATSAAKGQREATTLIGAHFRKEVRRALLLVQAQPANADKNLKLLLGEAINDLCAKYRVPQAYGGEE